ncbi:hypothetical protein INR49_001340 [Caranx melampygus]|nr:hypothetical protein INR49_001340 [Caranx melampygus]
MAVATMCFLDVLREVKWLELTVVATMWFYWLCLKLPSTAEARRSLLVGSKKTKTLKTEMLVFVNK